MMMREDATYRISVVSQRRLNGDYGGERWLCLVSGENDEERDSVRGRDETIARCGGCDGEVVAGRWKETTLVW